MMFFSCDAVLNVYIFQLLHTSLILPYSNKIQYFTFFNYIYFLFCLHQSNNLPYINAMHKFFHYAV